MNQDKTVAEQTLVVIPTYNEVEYLPTIISRVREAQPEVHVLVVDDNSPDGTGQKADELAAEDDQISVLHRPDKTGLLDAYRAGFAWGLERDYQVFVEMDADGSHAPEELHLLLDEIDEGADLVIGSRYIEGGSVSDWPQERYALSKAGNAYISVMLGTGLTDMTAGYRAIRRSVLEAIDPANLSDTGYIFQVDFAYRAVEADFDVREVPITFSDRKAGESKLDGSFVAGSLVDVTSWGIKHHAEQIGSLISEVAKLAVFEYKRSSLPELGGKLRGLAADGVNLTGELINLGKFEIQRMRSS